MNLIKSFLKFSFGSWIGAGISFFTTPIITLLILPEEFGKAAMFTLTNSILLQIILAGGDQGFMRFFYEKAPQKRPSLLWHSIFPSLFIWGMLSLGILVLWNNVSQWLVADSQFLVAGLLCVFLLLTVFDRYAFLVVRMQQKGTIFSLLRIFSSIFSAIIIILYCKYISRTFYAIVYASILSVLATTIISIIIERRFWFSKISLKKDELIRLLKYGVPLAPACLISILFEGLDKAFLRSYVGFEEMGLYVTAYKIVALLAIVQTGFSMFWTPVSFEHYEKNPEDTTLYEQTFRYLLVVLSILGLLLMIGKDLIILIFAKDYRGAASMMPFLIFIPIMYTLTEITCLGIYFKKKSVWQLVIFSILLVFSTTLNFILVPLIGAKGAALAVAVSYILYFYLRTYISIRLYPMNFELLKASLTFLMLFVVAGINTFIPNKIIGISCAGIAILIYLLFHLSIIKGMLIYFKQLIPSR